MIAPATKTLSANRAKPPNWALRRRTSFPKAGVTALSFELTKQNGNLRKSERRSFRARRPVVESSRALPTSQPDISGMTLRRERRRRNNVPRQDVPLGRGQIGSDRLIGVRHCAEHRLHGGRVLFHPLQAFACINRERARGFLRASAVRVSRGRAHCVGKMSPGVLLAGFGSDPRFE